MAEFPDHNDGADGAGAPKPVLVLYQKDGEISAQPLNGTTTPFGGAAATSSPGPIAQSRDLLYYWNLLKRYRWALVLSVGICTLISAYIAFHTPRVYSASSGILISNKETSRALLMPDVGVSGPNNELNTQVVVIKSRKVMMLASDTLKREGVPLSPGAVAGAISVENVPDTSV
ncbi:MAG: hypothetical protein LC772_02715, partial [Chloroflexi bacterium]|nr:hypothetical protein [Chloroflexota bacterium]